MNDSEKAKCPRCGNEMPSGSAGGLCPRCAAGLLQAEPTEFTGETGPHGTNVLRQPPSPDELAAKFPQLEILELLGRGGMGAVYKARQKELGRVVALKILPPGIGDDPSFGERFTREARALAQLNHSGIVTLYEFGRADGLFYFLMEFVDGVNLRRLMDAGRISSREALAIVPQICDALQYAHDQGIVHRDIKPENVLLDRRGRVKVADFGLAKLVGAETLTGPSDTLSPSDGKRIEVRGEPALTEKGKVMGTPNYIAPEQMEHPDEADHRADIYALGVVLYQMLTGELPGKPLQPPSRIVHIDVRLDEIVLRALEQKPELRYQQASVLKTDVETIAAGTPMQEGPAKSQIVRLVEILSRTRFTSPAAIKALNISALGFLGFLAGLGTIPVEGMRRCYGFSGFFGFFGLIGVAFIIESVTRRRAAKPERAGNSRRVAVAAGVTMCAVIFLAAAGVAAFLQSADLARNLGIAVLLGLVNGLITGLLVFVGFLASKSGFSARANDSFFKRNFGFLAVLAIALPVIAVAASLPPHFAVPIGVLCLLAIVVAKVKTVREPFSGKKMSAAAWTVLLGALGIAVALLTIALVTKPPG